MSRPDDTHPAPVRTGSPDAAWRLAVARRIAAAHPADDGVVAIAVAGSVAAGTA